MTHRRLAVLRVLAVALAACNGTTAADATSGTVSGTADGTTFSAAAELAYFGVPPSQAPCAAGTCGGQEVSVILSSRSDATCALVQSEAAAGSEASLANLDEVAVSVLDQTGDVAPGTYGIGQKTASLSSYAVVNLSTTGAECSPGIDDSATSGTVTLSQVNATRVAGSYSATFGDAGVLSGSFDVPICVFSERPAEEGVPVGGGCLQ